MRMRRGLIAPVVAVAVLASAGVDFARAQSFYEGKTVRINVGFAAGGGYDTYARLLSRHLGRHIPGNPTLIVDNMPGAGSLIAANQLFKVAKPDGLTLAHFNGVLFLGQVLGQPGIEFDSRRFELIGAAVKEDVACAMTKASGITCAKKFPDLPNVPLAIALAKTDEARQLIQVGIQYAGAFARPFALPPGTPRERVQVMRRAFQETLKDRALVAEAEKTKLTLDPVTGEELEKMVADVFTLDPTLAAK